MDVTPTLAGAVVVDRLTVRRDGRVVLDDLSCRIPAARVTGLLGPSGSGKTTLMRAVVGVQRILSGTVTVLGLPAGSASARRRVAYMTQAASVYLDLSVRENLDYYAAVAGAPASRAREVLEQVGLLAAATSMAGNLSGGQISRVSLACALVGDPEVLVLDEPTVGQDPVLREELWADFRGRAAGGTTVLVSSHVMEEAERCDDLLLLREGRLLAHDTPQSLRRRTGTASLDAAFLRLIREDR
jgi:ABC-2 type transport system ATP-binding protein